MADPITTQNPNAQGADIFTPQAKDLASTLVKAPSEGANVIWKNLMDWWRSPKSAGNLGESVQANIKANAALATKTGQPAGATAPAAPGNDTTKKTDAVSALATPTGGSSAAQTPVPKPTSFIPPVVNMNVPIDYNANKYYFRPGETIQQYMTRTQGLPTPTDASSATNDGTVSSNDQQKMYDALNGSGVDTSNPSSVMGSISSVFGGGNDMVSTMLDKLATQLMTPGNSFVDQYNQLLAQSGLSEDQAQMVNLKNIMNGTENDIRQEITAAGGFASESQVQAMTYQRNRLLEKQYGDLANVASLKQNMLDTQVGLMEKDQTYKENMFNVLSKIEEFGINQQTKFQNNTFNRLKWLASTGGLQNITPTDAYMYSVGTGGQISPDEIMSAAKNTSDLKQLQLSIDQLRVDNYSMKGITGQTFGTVMDQYVRNAMSGAYGTSGARENVINLLTSEFPGQDPATIQKAIYDRMPDGWENNMKLRTATTLNSNETQNILSDISGGASLPQLISAYPDVNPATLQSFFTSNLNYGTASSGTGQ